MKLNKATMNSLTCLKVIVTLHVWAICWIVGELASVGSLPLSGNSNVRTKGSNSWYGKKYVMCQGHVTENLGHAKNTEWLNEENDR